MIFLSTIPKNELLEKLKIMGNPQKSTGGKTYILCPQTNLKRLSVKTIAALEVATIIDEEKLISNDKNNIYSLSVLEEIRTMILSRFPSHEEVELITNVLSSQEYLIFKKNE